MEKLNPDFQAEREGTIEEAMWSRLLDKLSYQDHIDIDPLKNLNHNEIEYFRQLVYDSTREALGYGDDQ